MCCKVFQYEEKDGSSLYINADDKANPELVLELYLTWYNHKFAPFEDLPFKEISDIKYVCSFCPIDFYNESRSIVRGNLNAKK